MSKVKPAVLMFQDDYDRVAKWVLTYPDRETGGQMFGLWRDDRKPYVNIIIGPGQNCSHGTHSFHQDIDYLKNVGTFLNTEYMMCHIGEWHSHHKLRLRQPSSGDLNSIWRHFPAGVEHFLLIIATIENGGVRLNPWLFTASTHKYEGIDVEYIPRDNVFMLDDIISRKISKGEEKFILPQPQPMNTSEAPDEKREQRQQQNLGSWYLSDSGAHFFQVLNSKLEEIIDARTNIEKTLKDKCLKFSCRRNTCLVDLTFPEDFPNSAVKVSCRVPDSSSLLQWTIAVTDQISDETVEQIVQKIKDAVPTVYC